MGWPQHKPAKRVLLALLLVGALALSAGCLEDGPRETVRLRAESGDPLHIGVNDEGWFVALGGAKSFQVLQQIAVDAPTATMRIVWHNDDERFHEIMFQQDHSDADTIHINPGERVERWVELDFDRHIHSHYAPELPELHLRIERTRGR